MITPIELFNKEEGTIEEAVEIFREFAIANGSPKSVVNESVRIYGLEVRIVINYRMSPKLLTGLYALLHYLTSCKYVCINGKINNYATPYLSLLPECNHDWKNVINEFKKLR